LAAREVRRFFRQRSRIVGALGTPVLFWILIGSGLGNSFQLQGNGGVDYLEYFFPGTLVLILLFSAIFATFSIIDDRNAGFLQGVLASPAPRQSIVLGKVLGGATLAFLQAALFLLLAPTVGIRPSLAGWLLLLPVLYLIAMALTALGFFFAWQIDSTQGYHSVMNILLFPMWLLSGAFFPQSGAYTWVAWIMALNPLTYGMAAVRRLLYGNSESVADLPSVFVSVLATTLFGAILFGLSAWQVGRKADRNLA
jgi:ABC-2 type transport system permease protein